MSWYNCSDCDFMDLTDTNRYGECYCSKRRHYYKKSDTACNYFQKEGNYKGNGSSCYITTCVCDILNKEDNCNTLETLRGLRGGYMRKRVDCYSMLREYKVIGPEIVKAIIYDNNKEQLAKFIYNEYLTTAVTLIKDNKPEEAIDLYINMTNFLLNHYGITTRYTEKDVDDEINIYLQRKRKNK